MARQEVAGEGLEGGDAAQIVRGGAGLAELGLGELFLTAQDLEVGGAADLEAGLFGVEVDLGEAGGLLERLDALLGGAEDVDRLDDGDADLLLDVGLADADTADGAAGRLEEPLGA